MDLSGNSMDLDSPPPFFSQVYASPVAGMALRRIIGEQVGE